MEDTPVATFANYTEAAEAAVRLQAAGIPSVLGALGPGFAGWGNTLPLPHELRVRPTDVARAQKGLSTDAGAWQTLPWHIAVWRVIRDALGSERPGRRSGADTWNPKRRVTRRGPHR